MLPNYAASAGLGNQYSYNLSNGDEVSRRQLFTATPDNPNLPALPSSNYAIGAVSGEFSATSIKATGAPGTSTAPWGFLRLDGFLPTNTHVAQGLYNFSATSYFHCNPAVTGDEARFCSDLTGTSTADNLASYAAQDPPGIYPIASSATSLGVYYNNGKTCSGTRHH